MKAIVSDIHSNVEAFRVVLDDIESHGGVTEIIALGDIIGYGPNPKESIDLASGFKLTLLGNHESALMNEREARSFTYRARAAIDWTRDQLGLVEGEKEANAKRWDFLGELVPTFEENGSLFVHGSPRDPTSGYIYPRDINNPRKLESIFEEIESICFVGHTHVPGVFTEDMQFLLPDEFDYEFRLEGKKVIINVGSVGQPRDLDPRACYVIFDGETVFYRKLDYDVEETVEKILSIQDLDPFLAERLRDGK